jgi:hypothetical protein
MVRARLGAWGLVVGGVVAWLLVGGLAHAADSPTVTFTAIGAPPLACGARPDVNSVSVSEGTAVVVANHTGVPARVVVAGQTVLTVDHGAAGLLTLAAGSYSVELVPQCVVVANLFPLTVTVASASSPPPEPSSPGPPESASPPPGGSESDDPPPVLGPAAPGSPTSGDGGSSAGRAAGAPPKRTPSGTPLPAEPASPTGPATASTRPAPGPTGVVQAEAIPWTKPEDPKGVRLLAVIAAICVLGVTAAIIRSIVRLDA